MQRSTQEPITYQGEEGFEGVTVQLRPLTEPDRVKLLGAVQATNDGHGNIGEIALRLCRRHVVGWDGLPVAYQPGEAKLDAFPAELMLQVLGFLIQRSALTEDDAQD